MRYTRITGTGSYLPDKVVTNDDLAKIVDTSDAWITERTGIKRRHVVAPGEQVPDMAEKAAAKALNAAGVRPNDVGLTIVATCTPAQLFPCSATVLQHRLGITNTSPAFDLNIACSGFIYALSVADQFIKSGAINCALVVGADAMTKVVNWHDRSTCVLFADGAGAAVLKADNQPGVYATRLHADGGYSDLLALEGDMYGQTSPLAIKMQGNAVFKVAVTKLGEVVREIMEENHFMPEELDWLIPHQANLRIIEATAKRLNLTRDKIILTVADHGNTSAASVPLALDEGICAGKVRSGDLLLFEAFSAGFAWGAALVKY